MPRIRGRGEKGGGTPAVLANEVVAVVAATLATESSRVAASGLEAFEAVAAE